MNLVVNTHSPLWSTPTESSPSSGQHPLLPSVTVSLSLSQLYLVSVFLLYGFPALFFKHSDFLPRHPTRRAGLGFGEYQPHVLGGGGLVVGLGGGFGGGGLRGGLWGPQSPRPRSPPAELPPTPAPSSPAPAFSSGSVVRVLADTTPGVRSVLAEGMPVAFVAVYVGGVVVSPFLPPPLPPPPPASDAVSLSLLLLMLRRWTNKRANSGAAKATTTSVQRVRQAQDHS